MIIILFHPRWISRTLVVAQKTLPLLVAPPADALPPDTIGPFRAPMPLDAPPGAGEPVLAISPVAAGVRGLTAVVVVSMTAMEGTCTPNSLPSPSIGGCRTIPAVNGSLPSPPPPPRHHTHTATATAAGAVEIQSCSTRCKVQLQPRTIAPADATTTTSCAEDRS